MNLLSPGTRVYIPPIKLVGTLISDDGDWVYVISDDGSRSQIARRWVVASAAKPHPILVALANEIQYQDRLIKSFSASNFDLERSNVRAEGMINEAIDEIANLRKKDPTDIADPATNPEPLDVWDSCAIYGELEARYDKKKQLADMKEMEEDIANDPEAGQTICKMLDAALGSIDAFPALEKDAEPNA